MTDHPPIFEEGFLIEHPHRMLALAVIYDALRAYTGDLGWCERRGTQRLIRAASAEQFFEPGNAVLEFWCQCAGVTAKDVLEAARAWKEAA